MRIAVFDIAALTDLYTRVSVADGVGVTELQSRLTDLFARKRSNEDLNDYRLSKGHWKKLADEISPVSRFLRYRGVRSGRIRFPLNDDPPDAWLRHSRNAEKIGIEVTIAQGTERFYLAKELIDKGIGRGFIGLADDAHPKEFEQRMSRPRVMYTSEGAVSAIKNGILRCLTRKDRPRFAGYLLLIQAPLRSLPYERWDAIKSDLLAAAAAIPFREVHVIGNADAAPWGFQIKG